MIQTHFGHRSHELKTLYVERFKVQEKRGSFQKHLFWGPKKFPKTPFWGPKKFPKTTLLKTQEVSKNTSFKDPKKFQKRLCWGPKKFPKTPLLRTWTVLLRELELQAVVQLCKFLIFLATCILWTSEFYRNLSDQNLANQFWYHRLESWVSSLNV